MYAPPQRLRLSRGGERVAREVMGILHDVRPSWLAVAAGMTALPTALPLPSHPPPPRSLLEGPPRPEGGWGTEGLGGCAACLGGTGAAPRPASGRWRVGTVYRGGRRVETASERRGETRLTAPFSNGDEEPGLVFKAHRLLYHSTLGSRVIKKRKRRAGGGSLTLPLPASHSQ